jgi:hypothetical protein
MALALVACGGPAESVDKETVLDRVWEALEPNTSSSDRANWEAVDVRQVQGREVAAQFEGKVAAGCWKGPTPQPNATISASGDYWFVEMVPRPATALPGGEASPTAPPRIPEPFLRQAFFLVDPADGRIVARRLFCVIY